MGDQQRVDLFSEPECEMPASAPPPADTRPDRLGTTSIAYRDAATILTPARGFAKAYKFTLNPYSGCGLGCEYCYARFFAPSLDDQEAWGRWVRVKENAVELIRRARRSRSEARRLQPGDTIYMSSVTDPYQPVEGKVGLTRRILEELVAVQPRLTIQTRSPIAIRDIDLFKQFERIRVNITVTTDDDDVRKHYEPYCPSIDVRLRTARQIRAAGVPIGISISPMLPLRNAASFGAQLAQLDAVEFVTQFFKPTRSRFSAGSTPEALAKMREDEWTEAKYRAARGVIQAALGDRRLLEGTAGYAPA